MNDLIEYSLVGAALFGFGWICSRESILKIRYRRNTYLSLATSNYLDFTIRLSEAKEVSQIDEIKKRVEWFYSFYYKRADKAIIYSFYQGMILEIEKKEKELKFK